MFFEALSLYCCPDYPNCSVYLNSILLDSSKEIRPVIVLHVCTALEQKQVEADNVRKQHIRDTQEFSPADIVRINEGREQLQRSINAFHTELEGIDKKTWDIEMTIRKEHDKVSSKFGVSL